MSNVPNTVSVSGKSGDGLSARSLKFVGVLGYAKREVSATIQDDSLGKNK